MPAPQVILPNCLDNAVFDELHERLNKGLTVRMNFGGRSMEPMLHGQSDTIVLAPLQSGDNYHPGECLLFIYEGKHIMHRLLSVKGDIFTFRGDNCTRKEVVGRSALVAKLKGYERNGKYHSCTAFSWKAKSFLVANLRTIKNSIFYLFNREHRKQLRWYYFVALAILMWAPLNGFDLKLNQYVLNIRLDHLLHASVYIPCTFFLMDVHWLRRWRSWLCALIIGVVTETVQYILPYRGYDINDLVANMIGITLGWCMVLVYEHKYHRINP